MVVRNGTALWRGTSPGSFFVAFKLMKPLGWEYIFFIIITCFLMLPEVSQSKNFIVLCDAVFGAYDNKDLIYEYPLSLRDGCNTFCLSSHNLQSECSWQKLKTETKPKTKQNMHLWKFTMHVPTLQHLPVFSMDKKHSLLTAKWRQSQWCGS